MYFLASFLFLCLTAAQSVSSAPQIQPHTGHMQYPMPMGMYPMMMPMPMYPQSASPGNIYPFDPYYASQMMMMGHMQHMSHMMHQGFMIPPGSQGQIISVGSAPGQGVTHQIIKFQPVTQGAESVASSVSTEPSTTSSTTTAASISSSSTSAP